jgi:hypothetical protein
MPCSDGEITVHCVLDEEDYVAFTQYFYRHTRRGRWMMRKMYGIGVALLLVFAGFSYSHETYGAERPLYYMYYIGVSGVVFWGAYVLFLWYIRPTLARLSVRLGRKKGFLAPTTFRVSREGVDLDNADGKGKLGWDSVEEVVEAEAHLFLLLGGMNAFVIPRRCFEGADEAARCSALAAAYWNGGRLEACGVEELGEE